MMQPFLYIRSNLTQHSAYTSGTDSRKQKCHGIFRKKNCVFGKRIVDNQIEGKKYRSEQNAPDKAFGFCMLCKVASADKGGEAETGNQEWEHDRIAPTGFHHHESEKQCGNGNQDGGKEKTFEQIN